MNRTKQKRNIYGFILFWSVALFANPVYAGWKKPQIINLNREAYKADNKNWSIGQDEYGVLYFGNDVGLLEFDGIEWKLNELPDLQMVRSLAVSSHQTIFTGSYEEFGRWDRDLSGKLAYTSLSALIPEQTFKNDDFWKISIADNCVYFQSFNSIYIYDYTSVSRIPYDNGFLFLHKVRDKHLVQKIKGGVLELNDMSLTPIPDNGLFRDTDVRVILPYGEDQYLLGTAMDGLYIYDGEKFELFNPELSKLISKRELNCGILSSKGTYFLGTILDGIYEIDDKGEILNHISSRNTLQNNTILALYEDSRGNIWVALDRGISYIQYLEHMSCMTDPGGNTGAFYDVALWRNKLFFGTNQGVFYVPAGDIDKPNVFADMKLVDGTQGQVWKLRIIDGRLYCCHNRGLKEIGPDLRVAENYDLDTGVYDMIKYSLKGKDLFLFSTYNSVRLAVPGQYETFSPEGISEPVIATFVDHLNNIWLEHPQKGVFRCQLADDYSSFRNFTYYGKSEDNDLPYKLSLFKVGGKIAMLGNDTFYTYNEIEDAIVPWEQLNTCFRSISGLEKIIQINYTYFWALSKNAVYKFYYDGYKAEILENYNLGMNFSLVHGFENISIINDSINIICLDNGMLYYRQTLEGGQEMETIPIPHLNSFEMTDLNGGKKYQSLTGDIVVPYVNNSINFYFSAPDIYSSNLYFQYKLSNVDQEWSDPVRQNHADYPRLPQGDYEFQVRTIDYIGNYSDPVSLYFQVLPPWYRTIWAYSLYVIGLFILSFLTWLLLLRRYRSRYLQRIRQKEMNRLRELTGELKSEVERKNAELLTQTSFIINKNELILKMKEIIDEFHTGNKNAATTEFYRKINNHLNSGMNTEDDWKMFLIKFEEKHETFFKQMKMLYPDLTSNDLRLCACLKLNLETKEIASLMNLSVKAVENNRYRLRKKMGLSRSQNLNDVLMDL